MRSVIITGVSRGLGAALFDEFCAAGDRILALGRRFTEAQHAAERREPQRVCLRPADMGDPSSLPAAADLANFAGETGDVVLVHNAGVLAGVGAIGMLAPEEIQSCVAVNLTAPMLLTNALLGCGVLDAGKARRMLTVLFISSGAARRTIGGLAVYSATKRGGEQFFEVLAAQYADDPHVRVVNVDPGSVDTDMQAQLRTDAGRDVYFPAGGHFVGMHERGELVGSSDAARQILTTHLGSD